MMAQENPRSIPDSLRFDNEQNDRLLSFLRGPEPNQTLCMARRQHND